jgi:hypothetical protein
MKSKKTNGKMEEDVEPKDEDGVDGRGFCGWDGWVGGLGAVDASSIFGLVLRAGGNTRHVRDFSATRAAAYTAELRRLLR